MLAPTEQQFTGRGPDRDGSGKSCGSCSWDVTRAPLVAVGDTLARHGKLGYPSNTSA